MDNFIIIMTLMLLGVLLRRIPVFSAETGNILNLFVIYISLPALILIKIPELPFSAQLLVPTLMPWGMLIISVLLVLILSRIFRWERSVTGCLLLLVPLGNTSFLGIPMVKAFFGDHAIPYALLYDQLGSFLALATYGALILAIYGSGNQKPTFTTVIRKVVTFPPFIALILAFILKSFPHPKVVNDVLSILAATLIPLVMIAVGFQLKLRMDKAILSQLTIGLSLKLVAAPLIALALTKMFNINGETVRVSIFEAGMPPMVSAGALAILANLSPVLTAALVGIGILISFFTLPLLYQLL